MGRPRKTEAEVADIADQIEQGMEIESKDNRDLEFFSTGSDILDLICGKGLCFGKMINIIGGSSSGKSFIVSEIIAKARKIYDKKLKWVYQDCEAGYSFDSQALWGLDVVNPDNPKIDTVEDFAIELNKELNKLKPDERSIYVIDSYDALTSVDASKNYDKKLKAIEKGTKVEGSYGMAKAKFINEFFRETIREIKYKNCLFIVLSQTRDNIGAGQFEPAKKRIGGDSLQFYSAVVLWLRVAEKYGKAGRQTGISVHVKDDKNKLGKPFREGYIDLIFDYGIDNIASNIKFLYDLYTPEGRVKKSVDGKKDKDGDKEVKIAQLDWDGQDYTYKELIRHIEDNNFERVLTGRVKQKWTELERNLDFEGRKKRYE
jgi:RecA/RadA recombinase